MAIIINRKQRKLLLLSEVTKHEDFTGLYDFLERNETLSRRQLEFVEQLNNVSAYLAELLLEAQNEWKRGASNWVIDLGEKFYKKRIACELCGQHPIRYRYILRNMRNLKVLRVGSECVKEFGETPIRFYNQNSNSINKSTARRINELEKRLPGIKKFTDEKANFPYTVGYVVPTSLCNSWIDMFNTLRVEYNNYINGKTKSVQRFTEVWDNIHILKERITNFKSPELPISKNHDSQFKITSEVMDWLFKHRTVYSKVQENDGLITEKIIGLIRERGFMTKVLKKLSKLLYSDGIHLKNANLNNEIVLLEIVYGRRSLKGYLQYQKLIKISKGKLFNPSVKVNVIDYLDFLTLSRNSIDKIIFDLEKNFSFNQIEGSEEFLEDNEMLVRSHNIVYLINSYKLADNLKHKYFQNIDYPNYMYILNSALIEKMNKNKFQLFKEIRSDSKRLE